LGHLIFEFVSARPGATPINVIPVPIGSVWARDFDIRISDLRILLS
jgi:hypothetical protein